MLDYLAVAKKNHLYISLVAAILFCYPSLAQTSDTISLDDPKGVLQTLISAVNSIEQPFTGRGTATMKIENYLDSLEGKDLTVNFVFKNENSRVDVFESDDSGNLSRLYVTSKSEKASIRVYEGGAFLQRPELHNREVGRDFHPDVFFEVLGYPLIQWLEHEVDRPRDPKDRIFKLDNEGILHLFVRTHALRATGKDYIIEKNFSFDTQKGFRPVLYDRKFKFPDGSWHGKMVKLQWTKFDSAWYVSAFEYNEPPSNHAHTVGKVETFKPNVEVSDEEFTLNAMDVPDGLLIDDDIAGVPYRYRAPVSSPEDSKESLEEAHFVKDIKIKNPGSRIVHFPENRSMGMLYILDIDKADTSSYNDWQELCEATGNVTVPAGKALRLDLTKKAANDLSPLSKLRPDDLVMLFCYGVEIPDNELRHISHLTGLQELYMRDTGIMGTGLKYLVNLKSLKKLRLDNTHVGDNELAYLSDLPSLKSLNLWATPTNDAGMIHVGKMTSLEELVLSRGIDDEGLRHLKNLTSLRYLLTGNQSISDEGLAHLVNMNQMETLDLRDTRISNEGLIHLKKMTKLRSLVLYGTGVTEKGFVYLEGFRNLENLQVLFGVTDTGLMHLSKLPSLKNITVDGESISPKGIAILSKMKSLEHLYIDNTDKMDSIVSGLINLSGIKELTLGTGLTDEGLIKLKDMRSLKALTIGPSQITGKGIAALAEIPSLQILQLHQVTFASEDDWVALGKLSALQRLSLRHTRSKITDAHIAHLADLQSLKSLSIDAVFIKDRKAISSLDITDKGLEHISKLQSLERLTLRSARITDKGLKHLEKLKSLKWMDLQRCKVNEEDLRQLKKKLPALRWHL